MERKSPPKILLFPWWPPLLMFLWQMIALSGSTRRSWDTWRMSTKTWKLSSKCLTLTRSTISNQLSFGIKSISYHYEIDFNVGNLDSIRFDVVFVCAPIFSPKQCVSANSSNFLHVSQSASQYNVGNIFLANIIIGSFKIHLLVFLRTEWSAWRKHAACCAVSDLATM